MPVDSLLEMAQRACARCSARITDVGDLDYDLVRPILLKITSPEKLHQLEQNCPQLVGRNGELWLAFIKRDISGWETKRHEPRDPKNWWKVYRKLKEEARKDIEAGEDKLRAALNNIKNEKEQNVAQLMSRRELPRSAAAIRRPGTTYNYDRFSGRGVSKLSVVDKIRRGASSSNKSRMSRPMHELSQRATVVPQAPQHMVDELKKKAAVAANTQRLHHSPTTAKRYEDRVPGNSGPGRTGDGSYDILKDREARLRVLKSGKPGTNGVSDSTSGQSHDRHKNTGAEAGLHASFLEDFDNDEEESDGIFEDRPKFLAPDRPRTHSPARLTSQQVMAQKRRQTPSLFMTTKKVKK